jgi:hypothetical protein
LYPVGVFKRNFVNSKDLNAFRQELPEKINNIITEGVDAKNIQRSNQVHYYILNLNAREMKNQQLVDKNLSRIRLNFAPHAYLYQNAKYG